MDAQGPEDLREFLAPIPFVQLPCELDLLLFLYRHPCTLLTSEKLATFIGYEIKEVAAALENFTKAGLIDRTVQESAHAARLYELRMNESPLSPALIRLLKLASTRQGRCQILNTLRQGRERNRSAGQQLGIIECA